MNTGSQPAPSSSSRNSVGITLLSWGSLALAFAESICVAAVGLSGLRVAIGLSSLIVAAGPAHGFHRNAVRIPFLLLSGLGSTLVLLLVWNEGRMRKNPAAAWRIQPLTSKQKRSRRIQVVLAVLSLVVIALEVLSHPLFHHEIY